MTAIFKGVTRKQLRLLPVRAWHKETDYDSLLLLREGTKHESGWGHIWIVGCEDFQPMITVSNCSDDLKIIGEHRMDLLYSVSAFHLWNNHKRFHVSHALSSVKIEVK